MVDAVDELERGRTSFAGRAWLDAYTALSKDGRVLDVANVVWCTGFRTDFGWVDLPVFDEAGHPNHVRGVVESEPGLYFLGLIFLYSFSSDVLPGRGRDATYIAKHIASRSGERARPRRRALAAA